MSKCGSCGNFSFSLIEVSPAGSQFKMNFIQCSSCHVPVGVVDFFDIHSAVENLEIKLKDRIDSLENKMDILDHNLRILANK